MTVQGGLFFDAGTTSALRFTCAFEGPHSRRYPLGAHRGRHTRTPLPLIHPRGWKISRHHMPTRGQWRFNISPLSGLEKIDVQIHVGLHYRSWECLYCVRAFPRPQKTVFLPAPQTKKPQLFCKPINAPEKERRPAK